MIPIASFALLNGTYWHDITPYYMVVMGFCFIIGGCFGSFANAAAMRLVRDESPIAPPSRCRFCDMQLGWQENLPLLGWLFLRGRCGCRKFALPKRYVVVEWGFALLTSFLAITLPIDSFIYLTLLNIIMVIALLTDSEAMVLHPPSLLAGIIAGIAAPFIISSWPVAVADSVIGALVGAGLIIITNAVYRISRGRNGFGQGDIWLLAMIGAAFGTSGAIIIFFGASFIGAVTGIILILAKKADSGSKLPFGLFLSVVFLLYPALNMLLS